MYCANITPSTDVYDCLLLSAAAGEHWDDTIQMDTYYNPVPHFGFKHALAHSPTLRNLPLQPKPIDEKDPFGPGLDDF